VASAAVASAAAVLVADFKVAVSAAVKAPAEASAVQGSRPEVVPRHRAIARAGPMEDPIFSHNRSRMTAGLRYSSILSKPLGLLNSLRPEQWPVASGQWPEKKNRRLPH
jgi:hypothetical protein